AEFGRDRTRRLALARDRLAKSVEDGRAGSHWRGRSAEPGRESAPACIHARVGSARSWGGGRGALAAGPGELPGIGEWAGPRPRGFPEVRLERSLEHARCRRGAGALLLRAAGAAVRHAAGDIDVVDVARRPHQPTPRCLGPVED